MLAEMEKSAAPSSCCVICKDCFSLAPAEGLSCPKGHFVCRSDFNNYMSINVFSKLYKLKFSKLKVECPDEGCGECYNAIHVLAQLEKNERTRFIQIAHSLASDTKSKISYIKNSLLDALSLKCPHCKIAVDPVPDACSAVSCLSCGYYYCNCCFMAFGEGDSDRGSKSCHEHCTSHDTERAADQRSAFLSVAVIAAGQSKKKQQNLSQTLLEHLYNDEMDNAEVMLAVMLCHEELADAEIHIDSVLNCTLERPKMATDEVEAMNEIASESNEKHTSVVDNIEIQHGLLINALFQHNAVACNQLLGAIPSDKLDPNYKCKTTGDTLLVVSLLYANHDVLYKLLSSPLGYDPCALLQHGPFAGKRCALYIVVECGLLRALKEIVLRYPQINGATQITFDDNFGLTTLHVAAQLDKLDIAYFLIEELHADVNVVANRALLTPVFCAAFGSESDTMLRYLVSNGADVLARSVEGRLLSYILIEKGSVNGLKYVLSTGLVDINAPTTDEDIAATALWLAIHCGQFYFVPMLINMGADVNIPDRKHGLTPLQYAILKGADDVVDILLLHGANPYLHSTDGRSAMWIAAELGRCGVLKSLVGCVPNGRETLLNAPCSATNLFPIHVAAQFNQPCAIAVMIDLGVDISAISGETGLTALELALAGPVTFDTVAKTIKLYEDRQKANSARPQNIRTGSSPADITNEGRYWPLAATDVVARNPYMIFFFGLFAAYITGHFYAGKNFSR